jgi:hypothetical protein
MMRAPLYLLRASTPNTRSALPRAMLCKRFCSSQQQKPTEPETPEGPDPKVVIAKHLLGQILVACAGLSIGYGISEYLKTKDGATKSVKENANSDPDELANVQGAVTDRVYFDVQSKL